MAATIQFSDSSDSLNGLISSLNCLSCRSPCQTPHSLKSSLFSEKLFSHWKCFFASTSKKSAPRPLRSKRFASFARKFKPHNPCTTPQKLWWTLPVQSGGGVYCAVLLGSDNPYTPWSPPSNSSFRWEVLCYGWLSPREKLRPLWRNSLFFFLETLRNHPEVRCFPLEPFFEINPGILWSGIGSQWRIIAHNSG